MPPTTNSHFTDPRWDLTSIFNSQSDWSTELATLKNEATRFATQYAGKLTSSGETLFQALTDAFQIQERAGRLSTYASLKFYEDTRDQSAQALRATASAGLAVVSEGLAFIAPEILSHPSEVIAKLVSTTPSLQPFAHYISEIERSRPHTLSLREEQLLESFAPLLQQPEGTREALHDSDMSFPSITIDGRASEISHGNIDSLLQHPQEPVRKLAYDAYWGEYRKYTSTFASTLSAQATTSALFAKSRNYSSAFEESLFADALPADVYKTVLSECQSHYPLFQRYFRAKAKLLNLSQLGEHDIFASLAPSAPEISYNECVKLVLESLAPLGDEYVSIAAKGMEKEHWVDALPRDGKYSNAFSSGSFGTKPYFFVSYQSSMSDVGTFAHELGHSMHSYFTNRSQPSCYSSYAMTVAETASNLNQVLLRAHVLKTADRTTALSVLDEAFFFAHRYLFMMPTLSTVEQKIHQLAQTGSAMSGSEICAETVKAFDTAYGSAVSYDPEQLGIKWAHFCHFYIPFYFFQYAVGISSAMSIGQRLLDKEDGMQKKYLNFLSLGDSRPVVEIFQSVDIDITSPTVYREAFKVVEGYVSKLEELLGNHKE